MKGENYALSAYKKTKKNEKKDKSASKLELDA